MDTTLDRERCDCAKVGGPALHPGAALPRIAFSAEEWNELHKVGTPVRVTLDDGRVWYTRTRSEAWNLGHGQPVVMLEGKSGGYSLARVLCAACEASSIG